MKNKDNSRHFSSFRCDFDEENPNDKIMVERLLHLRHITQFSNKQLLNFLLCLGDDATSNCQTCSDFLRMLPTNRQNQAPEAQPPAAQVPGYQTSDAQIQTPTDSPGQLHYATEQVDAASTSSLPDTTLDDLFQNSDDPAIEEMIAELL